MNGEKTSPAPLEDALRLSPFISDALIFGANRSTPGALLIPSSKTPASDDPLSPFIPALQKMNALAPRHSQIPPELVILLPEGTAFPRASKGSLQRGQAYKTFEREIEQAYERFEGGGVGGETNGKEDGSARPLNLKGDELTEFVRKVVQEAAGERGEEIGTKEDLFAFGVNSLQSVRIRNVLQKVCDVPRYTATGRMGLPKLTSRSRRNSISAARSCLRTSSSNARVSPGSSPFVPILPIFQPV
jgi:hypothetical protein